MNQLRDGEKGRKKEDKRGKTEEEEEKRRWMTEKRERT